MTKILIAEDEPDIRDLVSITLQFAGFEVITVNNGAELVERAPQIMPDLILTDVRMPRMTGYEACRVLKEMPQMAAIPIVFLSAKGQEDEVKAGLAAGGEAYILKPFAPDLLVKHVKEMLELSKQGKKIEIAAPTDHIAQQRIESQPERSPMVGNSSGSQQMPSADGVTKMTLSTKPLNPAVVDEIEKKRLTGQG
jgi:CheY-like chemotaxis protein